LKIIIAETTISAHGLTFRPLEGIAKTAQTLNTFDDWIVLSNFVKNLMQTGLINFDVISNETLFTVVLSELSKKASDIQLQDFMKEWSFQALNRDRTKVDE
jgi:hypothetical protein